ncbi:MAG: radical SAM/SPASM domain-containing protein [Planctomycetota bacterium]|jgi:MoaA/NifB/PqqE/SkfB family radical SAM enzyme
MNDFVTGWSKAALYARIAARVAVHFARTVPLRRLPRVLRRAALFLAALRHGKAVRHGKLFKLHLYVPAYPTPAFFHALEKFSRPDPGPVTVVLSMTRACTYRCPHCYQMKDRGHDLPVGTLTGTVRAMQEAGVSLFDIEGGEPLLRFDRLIEVMEALDERAEIWVNTTGAGLTDEKIERLVRARLFGVMVSLHTPDREEFDRFTGVPGSFETACDALRRFARAGVMTAVNCCPIDDGQTQALLHLAFDLGCSFVQVIHPKPAGGWLGRSTNGSAQAPCANGARVPAVSAQVFEERPDGFGCTAGGVDRFYLGADGELQPCEFLNVSFGNVRDEGFETVFRRMRSYFRTPCTDWLCCTQAASIDRAVREHGLARTPVPWPITKDLVESWDRGPETRLYRRLGV